MLRRRESIPSAETGKSHTVGIVYSNKVVPDLQLSVTQWGVNESDSIQFLQPQTLVEQRGLVSSRVVRDSSGLITHIDASDVNFGKIDVAGVDLQLGYQFQTRVGRFAPSLSATDTYKYTPLP